MAECGNKKRCVSLPSVPDIVANLDGAKYFSILDASKVYLPVEMHPGDECKSAFNCHRGLYDFARMSFRLYGSPCTGLRLTDKEINEAKRQHASPIWMTFVVYSHTFDERVCHPKDILEKLRAAGITINPAKPQICSAELSLFGYRIELGQASHDPGKLQVILAFPMQKDVTRVRHFLGMIVYYRLFIPAGVRLQAPLKSW